METAQDKIIAQASLRNQNYVMGCNTPILATFSGADIITFVGTTMPEVLAFNMGDNHLELTMCLGKQARHIMMNRKGHWTNFYLIGINEQGDKGMITGKCRYGHFNFASSIDELNTEIKLYFDFELFDMYGFMGGTKEENELITETYQQLVKDYQEAESFRRG